MSRIQRARLRAHNPHTTTQPSALPTAPATASVTGRRPAARALAATATLALATAALVAVPSAAFADPGAPVVLAANTLPVVIANLQAWVMGILAALATLFLVLAGVYWATAGGDPAQVDKAKGALKNALVGYGLAVLAPILLEVVKGIVGG
ncbi:pilin [Dactylosporangium matsuzakiense]|uniref:TrbC/VIRB2 family protein n=1 Tax=Dactylosporangium matsuzakiense TaxID=53360 RepID=A0A9W6NPX9_9ACTN|nr:pilin [Dactylosporangium matsuzakiense]GLL04676.1 hypothetical protein GCM10017581_064230 [Dactylosporangium matsuzakiense]